MADDLRNRLTQLLLDRVAAGRYPSTTMLDRVEAAITDKETATRYVSLLLETMEQDEYPSPMMLERVTGLITAVESVT